MIEYSLYSLLGTTDGMNSELFISKDEVTIADDSQSLEPKISMVVESLKEICIGYQLGQKRSFSYFKHGITVIDNRFVLYFNTFEPVDRNSLNVVNFHAAEIYGEQDVNEFMRILGLTQQKNTHSILVDYFYFGSIKLELYRFSAGQVLAIAKSLTPFPNTFLKQYFQWHKLHHSCLSHVR